MTSADFPVEISYCVTQQWIRPNPATPPRFQTAQQFDLEDAWGWLSSEPIFCK